MDIKINKNLSFKNNGPPLIIAEISANHCGSKKKFLDHIISAKKNGADLVKIQTYEALDMTIRDNFVIKSGTWKGLNLYNLYKKAQTPFDWHYDAFKLAKRKNICLFSTPFSIRALNFLKKFDPPIYKISSFEITDLNLIKEVAKTKKPIIVSTGLSAVDEIKKAVNIIKKYNKKFIVMHCISGYPTPDKDMNLSSINYLKKKLGIKFVGISDHTKNIDVASLASLLGIATIEKHFTINKNNSPDNKFSILPTQLRQLKSNIIKYNQIVGKENFSRPTSERSSKIFRRSIYVTKTIKTGDKFTKKNVSCFRPNLGLCASKYFNILGKKSKYNLNLNTPLLKKHVK